MNPWDFCYKHGLEIIASFGAVLALMLRSLGIRRDLHRLETKLEKILERTHKRRK